MIYVAIDIETTGLNPKVHDIIEFAAVLDDLRNPRPLDELPKFHAYLKKDNYIGDAYALSMHPEIFKRIAKPGEGDRVVYYNELAAPFQNWLSKHGHPFDEKKGKYLVNVAGKNAAGFDLPFLNEKVKEWHDVQFRHRVIDPAILFFDPAHDDSLPDSKTCLERAGLTGDVKHTALEDALMVVELLRTIYTPVFTLAE